MDTIFLSCCSSQSAELSAESSHMSYLGSYVFFFFFLFLPSTCQDTGSGTITKPVIGPRRVTSLCWRRANLLKGQRLLSFLWALCVCNFVDSNFSHDTKFNNIFEFCIKLIKPPPPPSKTCKEIVHISCTLKTESSRLSVCFVFLLNQTV